MEKKNNLSVLLNGIIKENPVLVLILGTCPTLAVTSQAINGVGMGVAATLVLICSNIAISLLKNVIPDKVRIPCYIVLIAGFVTIVEFLVHAYAPDVYASLGIFLPLIVVNCIILGRAEMFAAKNSVVASAMDGIGMGIGFTLTLVIMGSIRELLGAGTIFGLPVTINFMDPMSIMILPPGGFLIYGILIAAVNKFTKGKAIKKKDFGCSGCPGSATCGGGANKGGCDK